MKKTKQGAQTLRPGHGAAAPAVDVTRGAVRKVFKKVKATRNASAKARRKGEFQ